MQASKEQAFVRVLVAIGVRLYRDTLAAFLSQQPGIEVVGTCDSEASTLQKTRALDPDVVLLDTGIPCDPRMVNTLILLCPGLKVLAVAIRDLDSEIIRYAEAGVAGFVTRDASFEELVANIRRVADGEVICPAKVVAILVAHLRQTASGLSSKADRLTTRELQVVGLIDRGFSNKEIATHLHIEVSTVKNHVHHILEKVGASKRAQAAARLRPGYAARTVEDVPA